MSKHPFRRFMPTHERSAMNAEKERIHHVRCNNDGTEECNRINSVHVDDNAHVKIDRYFDTEKLIEELKGLEL